MEFGASNHIRDGVVRDKLLARSIVGRREF